MGNIMRKILLTGFQPYAGSHINPASEVVRALDGAEIGGASVHGLYLPVMLDTALNLVEKAVADVQPDLVLSIGQWPGEPVIRVERFAVNQISFEIPDERGERPSDQMVDDKGPVARAATIRVARVVDALLEKGIPARTSETAGTFLCNATLYRALGACEKLGNGARCGFIHVPYLPEQTASIIRGLKAEGKLELHQRADLASMSLDVMVDAVRAAIMTTLEDR
jgi:pyroglutamyl-peptidase